MLKEQDRLKLDDIVGQMTKNGEKENDIRFVVDDFKKKYDRPEPINLETDAVAKQKAILQGTKTPVSQKAGKGLARGIFGGLTAIHDTVAEKLSNTRFFREAGEKIEAIDRGDVQGSTLDFFKQELSENLLGGAVEGAKSFAGRGTANVIDTIIASPINFATRSMYGKSNPVGNFFAGFAEEMRESFTTETSRRVAGEEFSLDKIKSPEFWLTSVAENIPVTLAFMKVSQGAMGLSGKLTSLFGKSKFAKIAGEIVNVGVGGTAMRGFESASEAEETYKSAIAKGMSEQEAIDAGKQVFSDNMKLVGLDIVQVALAYGKMPKGVSMKLFGTGAVSKILKEVADLATGATTEGFEEVFQYGAQQRALGETDLSSLELLMTDPQAQEAGFIGAVMGVAFQVGGRIDQHEQDKMRGGYLDDIAKEISPEKLDDYKELKTVKAKQEFFDELAETDEREVKTAVEAVEEKNRQSVDAVKDTIDTTRNMIERTDQAKEQLKQGVSETEVILELSEALGVDEAKKAVADMLPEIEAEISATEEEVSKQATLEEEKQAKVSEADLLDEVVKKTEEDVKKLDEEKSIDEIKKEIKDLKEAVKKAKPKSQEKKTLKKDLEEKQKAVREKRVIEKEKPKEIITPIEAQEVKAQELAEKQRVRRQNVVKRGFAVKMKQEILVLKNSEKRVRRAKRQEPTDIDLAEEEKVEALIAFRLKAEELSLPQHIYDELLSDTRITQTIKELQEKEKDVDKKSKKVDDKDIIKDKKDDKQKQDTITGGKPDGKGVSETLPVGKDKPKDTGRKDKQAKKDGQPTDTSGKPDEDTGKRPPARLTNEQISEKVEAVTEISNAGEVLLIGEVTDELKEQANQYRTGGESKEGRGILDEYFTDKKIVEAVKSVLQFPNKKIKVLEPAVGTGNFLYALPDTNSTVVAHEINDTTARIAKIFHTKATVYNKSFETNFIDERGNKKDFESDYDFVIGNPPYGEHRGKYLGLGEQNDIKKYEDYFIKRGIDVLKEGGTLAMLVPSGFLRGATISKAKQKIIAMAEVDVAFRFPVGIFKGTDIGTDLIVLKRKQSKSVEENQSRFKEFMNDGYFEKNPQNILGTVEQKTNRFGRIEDVVTGTLEDALSVVEERYKQTKAKDLVKEANEKTTEDNIAEAEDVLEEGKEDTKAEQKKELKKKITEDKKAKKIIDKKVKVKAPKKTKGVTAVALDSFFENDYTKEELDAWADTQQDGSLANPQGHDKSIINFYNGKWYNDFHYAQGDIYQKLERLDIDLDTQKINKEQYAKQKSKLEAVLPKKEELKDIVLSPDHNFLGQLDMETGEYELRVPLYKDGKLQAPKDLENSMRRDFSDWLNELPRGAFADSSVYEVRSFIRGFKVTGNDALRNESERRRRMRVAENLMKKYLADLSKDKTEKVENAYNTVYNSYHNPDYSQVPMTAQVNSNMFSLKDSQKAGVGRLIVNGKGLLAHEVGFGKTLSGVLTVQELLSKGWTKKPLIIVPKSVTKQWIEDTILNFLPNANVNFLGNLSKGFVKDLSSLKINEGSISVITHEGFKKLGFKEETYKSLVSKFGYISSPQLDTTRKREKQKEKDEEIKGVGMRGTREDLSFEDLGFDAIVLDEAHKANHIVAKAQPPEGKGNAWGSGGGSDFTQTPSQMGIKTWLASQYIQQQNNGNNTFLLSATPFTNKPIEFYSIFSLIGNERLERMGFSDVNSFFGMFFEQEVRDEFTADGKYITKTRIRRIKNFRQWRQLTGSMVDFRLEDETIIRPNKVEKNIHIPPNQITRGYFSQAQGIFEDTERRARALVGIGEVQKIGFSPYSKHEFVGEMPNYKKIIEDSPKLITAIKMVEQNLKDNPKGGQIIYSEVGIEMFPLIKEYLVKEIGLKKEEVEIITGSTPSGSGDIKDAKRKKIQDDLNSGKVKVLLGSTAIQVGMNLQESTTDMHILSLPWNFLDLRQVYGRAWRQGNQWENVRITHYLMQDSGDIHRSQSLANKQKLYDSAIREDANEVDISDIDHEEEALSLVSDPRRKAEMQIAGEVKLLVVTKKQKEADLSFSTRKIEKLQDLDKSIKRAEENLKDEKIKFEKELKEDPENADDYWVKNYEKEIRESTRKREAELAKLSEKGIDISTLIEKSELAQKEIEELEANIKTLNETIEKRVEEITKELPPPQTFDDKFIKSLLDERKEDNKTFYSQAKEPIVEDVTVETVEKPIKSRSGKVIKTKKTVKAVAKKKTEPKITKDKEFLKVLTDSELTVAEKVDALLGKKQEGKKFKDVGERVAGSKKENAVIQAVIQHGDDALLKQLASELGVDPLVAQLDKKRILEDVKVPTRAVEIAKKTPAWIAGYKVKVFNTIGKVPTIKTKIGRYGSQIIVSEDTIDNFIAKYPKLLNDFVKDLNAIKDRKSLEEFQEKYSYTFANIKDNENEPANIGIEVLGNTMRNAIRGGGKLIKDTRNVLRDIKEYEDLITLLETGAISETGQFRNFEKRAFEEMTKYKGLSEFGNIIFFEDEAVANKSIASFKKKRPKALQEAKDKVQGFETDFDRFVPEKTGGVAKQISDAEINLKRAEGDFERAKQVPEGGFNRKLRIEHTEKKVSELKVHISRLKGETTAIKHGNFEEIGEYDVKDSRFKKTQVNMGNLMKTYGFKSAQLGNYMDDISAHDHIVQTMGAMEDMSKILNVDFAKITNDLGLSVAFGARGGGNYNAHYEPTHNIINLTKKRGDGSFGHEFMHFLDWTVGKQTRSGKLSGAISTRYYQRTDIGKTADLITEALKNGITIQKDKTFKPDKDVDSDSYDFKQVAQWRNEDKFNFEDALNRAKSNRQHLLQAVADVYRKEFTASVGKKSNEYYKKSLQYGGGKDTSYWVRSHELWARAFQAYLQDKLEASDIKNNYLTRNTKDISVYPQGEERVEYNKLFDKLFEALGVDYKIENGGIINKIKELEKKKDDLFDLLESKMITKEVYREKALDFKEQIRKLKNKPVGKISFEPRFKLKEEKAFGLTDGGKFLEDVKRRLKIDFDVQFVDNILVSGNKEAYGVTYDNTIALVKDLANSTAQHEVVHLTITNMSKIDAFKGLTADEVLLAKAEELGIKLNAKNRDFIEEKLAQDFEAYVEKKSKPVGKIKAFFEKLLALLKRFAELYQGTRGQVVRDYYDILLTGESVNQEMIRLENNGLIESFVEEGVLDTSEMVDPSFYHQITLAFKDIDLNTDDFRQAQTDVIQGIVSETKRNPLIAWDAKREVYHVKDGNHRIVEEMNLNKSRMTFDLENLKFKLKEDRHFKNLKEKHNKVVDKMHTLENTLNKTRIKLAKALRIREAKDEVLDEVVTEPVEKLRKHLTNDRVLSKAGEKVAEDLGYNPKEINETLGQYLKSKEEYLHIYGQTAEQKREIANLNKADKQLQSKRLELIRQLKQKKARLEQMEKDILRGFKRGVKSQKRGVAVRRIRINELEKTIGISPAQRKRLIAGRNFETMSNKSFEDFMQDMIRTAHLLTDREALTQDILAEIEFKQFGRFDNLRLALGLPTLTAMNKGQLTQYKDALAMYEFGDVFLSKRQIETAPRTEFSNIVTKRELTDAIKEGTDLTSEDLQTVDLPFLSRFANGLRLSRHSNLLKYVVDNLIRIEIETEQQFIQHRNKIEELAKIARKSRKRTFKEKVSQAFVPTDELVFSYIEETVGKKEAFAKKHGMTKEEIKFGNAVIAFNRMAYDYMKDIYKVTSRFGEFKEKDYMVHIRRSFLEAVRDDGITKSVKEMFNSQKEAELSMAILDGKTGDIVPYEKWSPFHKFREGGLKTTKNVTKAHLIYSKTFFKKRSMDGYIPKLLMVLGFRKDIIAKTKEGLTIDGGVENFIKEYINNARGRKISESLIPKQGSTADATMGMAITATTILALGGRIGIGLASAVGEFVVTTASMILHPTKTFRGLTRTLQFKQAKKVREGVRHFIGINPLEELMSAEKGLTEKGVEGLMLLFSFGRYISHTFALQAELTPKEWTEAKVSTDRLLEISKEQSKFKKGKFHAGSLVGSTVIGRAFGQYLSWAFDIATTTASSGVRLIETARKDGIKDAVRSEYMKDVMNFTATAILFGILATFIPINDEDEENRTILFYIHREMNTLISAFPALIRYNEFTGTIKPTIPIIEKATELFTLALQLFSQEAYKRDGRGYGIGDKKFKRTAKKLFVPVFLQEAFGDREKRNTKNRLIKEAIDKNSLDVDSIIKVIYPDFGEKSDDYKKNKKGEIKKLYNIHKEYGFDNELVNIILHGDGVSTVNNRERAELMVQYSKDTGKQETRKELIKMRKNRNLCTDTKKRTGCFVSNRLWKDYIILLKKSK